MIKSKFEVMMLICEVLIDKYRKCQLNLSVYSSFIYIEEIINSHQLTIYDENEDKYFLSDVHQLTVSDLSKICEVFEKYIASDYDSLEPDEPYYYGRSDLKDELHEYCDI